MYVYQNVKNSKWASPTTIISTNNGLFVLFLILGNETTAIKVNLSYFLKYKIFEFITLLDLYINFYCIELCPLSRKLCTIVLPQGKYEYQILPMGMCNSPVISQEKMNELLYGLEYVRICIDHNK